MAEVSGQQRLRRGGHTIGSGTAQVFKPVGFAVEGAKDHAKREGQGRFPSLGRSFSRHGEEAAWRMHSHMFSDAAQPALAADLRNQNQYYNYQPKGGDFAPQGDKLIGLGSWANETGPMQPPEPVSRKQHFEQGSFQWPR